jgi:hypothetical protein
LDQTTPQEHVTDPVIVTGMHNSGTSILAEILHTNGLFLEANMGHYESHFFSIFVNDRLIMGGGNNWAKLPILPVEDILKFKDTIGSFIKKYWRIDYIQWGYDGVSPWGFKDPRACVLLPLYLELFPNAKIIHIRRNLDDVAASLCEKHKMGVGQKDDFNYWKQLAQAHVERVWEFSRNYPYYFELTYEAFCQTPTQVTRKLFNFIGLQYTETIQNLLKQRVSTSRIGSYKRRIRKLQQDP